MRSALLALALAASLAQAQPGTLDPSFGDAGVATIPGEPFTVTAVSEDGDGRVLVLSAPASGFEVSRLAPDGTVDASFGTAGRVALEPLASEFARASFTDILALDDGAVLVTGLVDDGGTGRGAVLRLTADGALDPAFGLVVIGEPYAMGGGLQRLAADGDRVRAAGFGFDARPTANAVGVLSVRVTPTGLDPDYGTDGVGVARVSTPGAVVGLVEEPDGRAVVLAAGARQFPVRNVALVARLDAEGAIEMSGGPGFGQGPVEFDGGSNARPTGLAVGGGRIYLAGSQQDGTETVAFLRALSAETGLAAASFGTDGVVTRPLGIGDVGLALDAVNQPVISVNAFDGTSITATLVRYDESGALDPAFGTGGVADVPVPVGLDFVERARSGALLAAGPQAVARVLAGAATAGAVGPAGRLDLRTGPNPTHGPASVRLDATGPARVSVVDALGREVAVLHEGPVAPGARWTLPALAAGLYVVRAEAGGAVTTQAVTVVR